MRTLLLGKTGLEISELGFGAIPIIRLGTSDAVKVLRRAYDLGITFFDTANMYFDSEEKIGRALSDVRHNVVIATKSFKRDGSIAADIELSLSRMKTDYIDLFQFHQVSQETDYQTLMSAGGAFEVASRAKEAGKIRHIGVTSHNLEMATRLVKTGLFSTIQFPFNLIEEKATLELFPAARERAMGILAMKPFAGGMLGNAGLCFKYLRQWPDAIPIPGFDTEAEVDEVVDFYGRENLVSSDDLVLMEVARKELGDRFCRRCEYCQPCPHGVMITPAMIYPVLARRMSPEIGSGFAVKSMESVRNCTECGECISRCPYGLPIPEMLKEHLALFEGHRAVSESTRGKPDRG